MNDSRVYRWLLAQSSHARAPLILSIILGCFSGVIIIAQAALLATLIDKIYFHNAARESILPLLIGLLTLIFFRSLFTLLREKINFKSSKIIKDRVRNQLFQHLIQYSPLQLSQHKTGALTTTLIEQVNALQNFFSDYLPQMMITIILPLIILIVVWMQNWVAGLVLLITAPLIPLFMILIGLGVSSLNQKNFQQLSIMSAHFLDALQGLSTLVLFHRAKDELNRIETVSENFRKTTMSILRVAFLSSAALELFSTMAIAVIAVYLGLGLLGFIHAGFSVHITLQQALFILLLTPEFYAPLRQLGVFYHARAEAIAAATDILKFEPEKKEISTNDHAIIFSEKKMSLAIQNLSFEYQTEKKIITHFNAEIDSGACVAITGKSGSGKSTLLQLIARFLTPTSGTIFVNHRDIAKIDSDSWYQHIALLQQHTRLFHTSIANNIALGNEAATKEQINDAAKKAGVFLFTDDLDQCIGENNAGFSGGQIQRIALARIILKDARMILLDEPTTYLDHENAEIIFSVIKTWRGKKTIIIATHDQRIIDLATQVISL